MSSPRTTAKLQKRVAQLEGALERVRHVGEALRRVTMAVGQSDELDSLLGLVVDTTTEVLDAERATLYLLDEQRRLVSRVKRGDEHEEIVIAIGQGIAGHVAKSGKPIRVKDAYDDPHFDPAWDKKSGFRTRSIVAVPLKIGGGEVIGVLQVLNKRGGGERPSVFTPYDTEMLMALGMQAAIALDKAQLFVRLRNQNEQLERATRRLERSVRDLELLYELEMEMSRAESVAQLARSVINLTAKACSACAGALLYKPLGGELTLYVVNLDAPDEVREGIVQPGEGIAARAMAQGKLLRLEDPKQVRDPRRVRELLGLSVESAIAAPLGDDNFGGAIALYNHRGDSARFTKADMRLLELVSANVGTELRVLESRVQRERAERLGSIGRLLSGVMHDLRTPLTVISGYVQLMQVADDPEARAEYGETVAEQFEIISAMQRDLLSYARGETPLLIRKVYLGRFCELLARQFQPELAAHRITLTMDIRNNGTGYFDERSLMRVLGNLVRNAIEAMEQIDRDRVLTIVCDRDDEDLLLLVTDTGPGIPKAIASNLFEPFVTEGKKLGTGLGLANVKKIVEEHGGSVNVDSSRRGTRFTVRIPSAMRPHSLKLERRTQSS